MPKRLLLIVLLVASCQTSPPKDTGSVTTSGPAGSQVVRLEMTSALTFVPNHVRARVGQVTITAANTGQVPHNLVFDDASIGKTGTVAGKTSANLTVTFARAGTYTFQCTFHPRMAGTVAVTR